MILPFLLAPGLVGRGASGAARASPGGGGSSRPGAMTAAAKAPKGLDVVGGGESVLVPKLALAARDARFPAVTASARGAGDGALWGGGVGVGAGVQSTPQVESARAHDGKPVFRTKRELAESTLSLLPGPTRGLPDKMELLMTNASSSKAGSVAAAQPQHWQQRQPLHDQHQHTNAKGIVVSSGVSPRAQKAAVQIPSRPHPPAQLHHQPVQHHYPAQVEAHHPHRTAVATLAPGPAQAQLVVPKPPNTNNSNNSSNSSNNNRHSQAVHAARAAGKALRPNAASAPGPTAGSSYALAGATTGAAVTTVGAAATVAVAPAPASTTPASAPPRKLSGSGSVGGEGASAVRGGFVSGPETLKQCPELLTEQEREEIRTFKEVYFIGTQASKLSRLSSKVLDDSNGDYVFCKGEQMLFRYEVEGLLGKGSFGQVLRCRDHKSKSLCAVKMVRNKSKFHQQALVELKVLGALKSADESDTRHIIQLGESFYFRQHLCFTFPLYSANLYEMLKADQYRGIPLRSVRYVARQLFAALSFLKQQRIIHCDIKPENILLAYEPAVLDSAPVSRHEPGQPVVPAPAPAQLLQQPHKSKPPPVQQSQAHAHVQQQHSSPPQIQQQQQQQKQQQQQQQQQQPSNSEAEAAVRRGAAFRMYNGKTCRLDVKLIDFGSSCVAGEQVFTYVQSRFYRAPEVILGLSYGHEVDVWSCGCVLAELLTGYPLLPGENEADQLSCITEILGLPPPELLAAAKRTGVFFKTAEGGRSVVLKPSSNSHGIVRSPGGSSLEHALRGADKRFVDFLHKCLKLDPRQRISPEDAERHEWMVADD